MKNAPTQQRYDCFINRKTAVFPVLQYIFFSSQWLSSSRGLAGNDLLCQNPQFAGEKEKYPYIEFGKGSPMSENFSLGTVLTRLVIRFKCSWCMRVSLKKTTFHPPDYALNIAR